jgi:Na+-driven multidrug efflux pump
MSEQASAVSLEQNEQFLKKAYGKALIPCMLSILSGNINILADGILVGQRLGTDALAAINFSLPVYLVLCIVGSFIVSGTAICAAEAIGNNQDGKAQELYKMSIFWCLLVSAVITAAGLLGLKPLAGLLCAEKGVSLMVMEYAGVTLAGALPKILIYIPFWYLRLDGRNRQVTWMMLVMGVGNIWLDWLFLYTFDLGVFGAALASVVATAVSCLLGFVWLCDKKSSFPLGVCVACKDVSFAHIAKAGSPSAMNNLFQTLRVMAVNTLLLWSGGSGLVASFTAVNCISAFAESVTGGVPQAASAMLGIYSGEHDNKSIRMLMIRQIKSGVPYCLLFSAVILAGANLIAGAYGLTDSLTFAFLCLSMGMVPALCNSMLSGYYNVSGRAMWANVIILLRVFVTPCASLFVLWHLSQNPWWFLFFGEILTLLVWFVATGNYHHFHRQCSRFLLMDNTLEESGRVINFSVCGEAEDICGASSKITVFCEENGMLPGQVMRVSLAMEELMTMIVSVNPAGSVEFDLRVYSLEGVIGIRIRYSGKEFNPLRRAEIHAGPMDDTVSESSDAAELDDMYLGIRMIEDMVETSSYQRTFGMNTIQIYI